MTSKFLRFLILTFVVGSTLGAPVGIPERRASPLTTTSRTPSGGALTGSRLLPVTSNSKTNPLLTSSSSSGGASNSKTNPSLLTSSSSSSSASNSKSNPSLLTSSSSPGSVTNGKTTPGTTTGSRPGSPGTVTGTGGSTVACPINSVKGTGTKRCETGGEGVIVPANTASTITLGTTTEPISAAPIKAGKNGEIYTLPDGWAGNKQVLAKKFPSKVKLTDAEVVTEVNNLKAVKPTKQYIAHGEYNGNVWIIIVKQEGVQFTELQGYKDSRTSLAECSTYMQAVRNQAAKAVLTASGGKLGLGPIHQDLHPGNVLFEEAPALKANLVDWGQATMRTFTMSDADVLAKANAQLNSNLFGFTDAKACAGLS